MFGVTNNCPTTAGTEKSLSSLNLESNGFSTLSTGGCLATDETFGNFGISGFTGGTTVPSLTNTSGYTTPDASSDAQNLVTNMAASLPLVQTGTGSSSGDLTLLTQFGSPGGPPANNTSVNAVDVVVSGINLSRAQASNYASIQVTVDVCEDTSTLNGVSGTGSIGAFSSSPCSGGSNKPNGTLVTMTGTITNSSSLNQTGDTITVVVPLSESVNIAAIDVNVELTSNDQGAASFSGLALDFADPVTPEPSTFVLMGSALAGLGFYVTRRNKAQRVS